MLAASPFVCHKNLRSPSAFLETYFLALSGKGSIDFLCLFVFAIKIGTPKRIKV